MLFLIQNIIFIKYSCYDLYKMLQIKRSPRRMHVHLQTIREVEIEQQFIAIRCIRRYFDKRRENWRNPSIPVVYSFHIDQEKRDYSIGLRYIAHSLRVFWFRSFSFLFFVLEYSTLLRNWLTILSDALKVTGPYILSPYIYIVDWMRAWCSPEMEIHVDINANLIIFTSFLMLLVIGILFYL